ncbi:MAG: arylsulfatase [Rikenellaceae bacterium]
MNNNNSLMLLTVGLTAFGSASLYGQEIKPNVLLILTDDQGWGDFGFNGNDIVNTPVLDALSQKAAYLTDFHVSPLSASTRAGILTGRDHLRTGAMSVTRSSENMDSREQTIAEVMKANNYATGCFGKWHNGAHYPQDPNGQGFDKFIGFCSGHLTNYFNARLQDNQKFFNAEGYITDVLTNSAIDFIDENVDSKTPFFCYVPYNAPHAPYQVPDEYYEKYASLVKDDKDTAPAVYAMCENLDYNIGRLLNQVTERGIDDNTIIIFMTDNGPNGHRYNGILRGIKGNSYEGGFKVPCLVYWKGKIEAMQLPQTASYVDIMPTILDLCNIKSTPVDNRKMSGVSLKGILTGQEKELEDRYLFTHRSSGALVLDPHDGVIYNDRYKMITFANGRQELYDKKNDPSEQNDIFDKNTELTKEFVSAYNCWFSDVTSEYERSISRTAHIGILEEPVELPAHEALMTGRTRYYTNIHGWAGDWMVDMAPQDTIYWDVIVDTEADYKIALQYSSEVQKHKIALGGAKAVTLAPYKATMIESPDRTPRVEAYEQIWGTQELGVLHLPKGENRIMLLFDKNKEVQKGSLEVKGIEIIKL